MVAEISRKAVLVLVLIAVVISFLSTTFVLTTVMNFNPVSEQSEQVRESNAKVTLIVPQEPPTGRVILTVPEQGG